MFFCGTCVAGYKHSADNTYVITDDANSLIIESGVFDHLYVTRSVEDQEEEDWSTAVHGYLYAEQLDQNQRLLHTDAECDPHWRRQCDDARYDAGDSAVHADR